MESNTSGTPELHGAAALMQWLGEHKPEVQRTARALSSLTFFYAYMGELSGARFSHSPNSHDEYCEVYLAAFKAKYAKAPEPAPDAASIPFERPRTQREAEWMLRQAMAKDVAEAAAREAEARRCAPLPACAGLLRLAPMR